MRTRLIWLSSIATALFSASCYAHESAAEYKHTNTLKALDFIKQNEIYNPESVIPPQCYTKTEGKHNPCMACHQSYPSTDKRPNIINDGDLQGDYQFSEAGMTNSWTNLFVDRSLKIKDIKDSFISEWVKEDNYHSFINDHENHPQIEAIKLDNLALPKKAFFENGLAKDGSHWVAFNYKPFPSTFWPTNGSTGDVMIRLDKSFRQLKGEDSLDVYFANLSLLEMSMKRLDNITVPNIDERKLQVDLNDDGKFSVITSMPKRSHYVGDAKVVPLTDMLYPKGTEFLHTVRYIGVDENGKPYNAERMKEVRYMKKHGFKNKRKVAISYHREAKEKEFEQLPRTVNLRKRGIDNGFSWTINGFIEDEKGRLRQQHYQELQSCNGCHKTIGTTIDQTFSFARKVEGVKGWGYINLKTQNDTPTLGQKQGEFLTYLQRVGGGDEFRQNKEMLQKWFNHDGSVKTAQVQALPNIYELIMPSRRRALDLNKAYFTIMKEQSYLFGRDATLGVATNVLEKVEDNMPPLEENFRYGFDIRLDWAQAENSKSLKE
ncbi:hypothetical protein CWB73_18575 [Pseudoalteromonas phenolica]|uniref:Lipoprotein n=1 Tax=Pseudoalteromonas phenolica TaxID=161398 RepID=A0A5S3YQ15_9GAMM|nr:hypothetical protein [Pseudoalteromonas phenolica]TMP77821.1 hypothetical protein CWB73_18575 [Pseudoalteromonas phenolica]